MGGYSFDKKRAVWLLLSCLVLSFLIFTSGWLVAIIMFPEEESVIASNASAPPKKLSLFQRIKAGMMNIGKNALRTGSLRGAVVQEVEQTASETKRKAIKTGERALTPKKPETPDKQAVDTKKIESGELPASAKKPSEEKKVSEISKKDESSEDKDKPKASAEPDTRFRFCIEVDTFIAESKADNMLKLLMGKGYKAEILKMSGDNPLYIVQIGDYGDLKSASDAAFEFKEKEGISAVVRPISATLLEEIRKSGKNTAEKK